MASTPHPHAEEISPETQSLPDEEHIDSAQVDDDLAQEPSEKHNATDGYAPAEDPDVDTAELDELDD
jgi:hypothetical protein